MTGSPTLLLVVAHPDDETFGCGSVLLHAKAAGARTVVVCATRGEAGKVRDGVAVPPGGVAGLREGELRDAAGALGVDEVEVLDLTDSGMDGDPPAGSLAAADPDAVARLVAGAVHRHGPSVVVTLSGDDGHRDHLRVREAVERAVGAGGPALYVHCLARSLMHEWVLARAGDERSAAYVELPDIGTPDDDVTTLLDTSAHYRARLDAIARHRSQHSPFEEIPEDLRRRFLTAEHLARLRPTWSGGPRESTLVGL